jgi:ribonuclease E
VTAEPAAPSGATPRKATARKATARKATSRTATAPDITAPDAENAPILDLEPAVAGHDPAITASEPAAGGAESTESVAPTKTGRRRSARRPADASSKAASTVPTSKASQEIASAEIAGPATVEPDLEPTAPVKATRRRGRGQTAATFGSGNAPETDSQPAATVVAEVGAVPVLFQAPIIASPFAPPAEAPSAPRRRRRATDAAPAEVLEHGPLVEHNSTDDEIADEQAEAAAEDENEADGDDGPRRRRRRGRRGRGARADGDGDGDEGQSSERQSSERQSRAPEFSAPEVSEDDDDASDDDDETESAESASSRRRRRRRRGSSADAADAKSDDPTQTVTHVRPPRQPRAPKVSEPSDEVKGIRGSSRLEAKRQRRRDGRESSRRRVPILTEAEFLARRESVDRVMAVRQRGDRTQIAILEDDILVEHYVTRASATSYVGNVYLGRVQNVLPSMEAAFVDIGKGRNGVLYAGEVNWDAAGLEGKSRAIEAAMKSGDAILVQVTKDPIGHKGARLTSQVSLPGRFLVYVPGGGMTGISRKLPDTERSRLKAILKKIVPEEAGVIVRTAAEGASEADLISDVERLKSQWEAISSKAAKPGDAPLLLHGEPDLAVRVVRDVFNEDFQSMIVEGNEAWNEISDYLGGIAPELAERVHKHAKNTDLFGELRVDEQLAKALDRKVYLPSGGSLVIDRTEAMVVVDVNTGKFTGSGGNLESTVTKNNLEAAEEIVRQLRLRDVGGIVVIDFIDMVLESNRDLVLRRLTECLGRDRTKHQVAEVTSLGLVQMTRKRVGEGLLEAFSETCEVCKGRGVIVHTEPVFHHNSDGDDNVGSSEPRRGRKARPNRSDEPAPIDAAEERRLAAEAEEQRRAATLAINAMAKHLVEGNHAAQGEGSAPISVDELSDAQVEAVQDIEAILVPDRVALPEVFSAALSSVVDGSDAVTAGSEQTVPDQSEHESVPALASPAPRPRRRRAASRPAGPPVVAG